MAESTNVSRVGLNDTVELGGAVRRESAVAVWVGPKRKIPRSRKVGETWDTQTTGTRERRYRTGMDITWLTDRIAVGGGIWTAENMAKVAAAEITHIIDMQIEFDDTPLAAMHGIEVLWNPTDDDFEQKPAALFER